MFFATPLALLLNTARVEAQAQRRSVIDYFHLLPTLGIEDKIGHQKARQLLLPESDPVIVNCAM